MLDKFAGREFTCEYKYDGERAQIHVTDGGKTITIFSRCAPPDHQPAPERSAEHGSTRRPSLAALAACRSPTRLTLVYC